MIVVSSIMSVATFDIPYVTFADAMLAIEAAVGYKIFDLGARDEERMLAAKLPFSEEDPNLAESLSDLGYYSVY